MGDIMKNILVSFFPDTEYTNVKKCIKKQLQAT